MQPARDQFLSNIERARLLGGVYANLASSTTSILDVSDLLRAQFVLTLSAFDTLVHEVTRLGMLEVAVGVRAPTDAYHRFQISLESVQLAVSGLPPSNWFDNEIRRRHGYLTFQMPDKVADAIRLVSPIDLWPTVAASLGKGAQDVKSQLRLIVERRNKIAHEADIDPSYPGSRWPIDKPSVDEVIAFIESVGIAIVSVI